MIGPSPEPDDASLAEIFWRQGSEFHHEGRLAEALAAYDEVVGRAPSFADVYLNRAAARLGVGAPEPALEDVNRLLALAPERADGLSLRGAILHRLGRFEAALEACDAALQRNPGHASGHNNRGLALAALGRLEEALASYDEALRLDPGFAAPQPNRGAVLARMGRAAEALAAYDQAIEIAPSDASLHHDRAVVLEADGQLEQALGHYRQAAALSPLPDHYNALGNVLLALDRFDPALEAYAQAFNLAPDLAQTSYLIGRLLSHVGRMDEARLWFERVLDCPSRDGRCLNSHGLALNALWRFEEAVAVFQAAIQLDPLRADLHHNLGIALHELGGNEAVRASYDRAIELDPHNAIYRTDRGLQRLMAGDAAGWEEAEWRKRTKGRIGWLDSAAPPWTGAEPLEGKTLLAYSEQGLGDTIQFCRYLPAIVEQGAKVILSVQPPLRALISTLSPDIEVIGDVEQATGYDFSIALMSLPWALGTDAAMVPGRIPYLKAEPARVRRWRRRLGTSGLKIGVAWQGSARGVEIRKAFQLEDLQPIGELAGVRLISLQKGASPTGLSQPGGAAIEYLGEDFDAGPQGFLDTAAVMQSLDLVITTDTSVAHLAGALGRPTWIALKYVPDWRWGFTGATSPWYPTVRLFRQCAINDWSQVFTNMATCLRDRLASPT